MSEEMYGNCIYRFENGSCKDCPLKCKGKECELQRLKQENKKLKDRNANLRLNLATYDLPEIKKVLTDWRTGELDIKFKKSQKKYKKLYKTLEEIKSLAELEVILDENSKAFYPTNIKRILDKINEVLND